MKAHTCADFSEFDALPNYRASHAESTNPSCSNQGTKIKPYNDFLPFYQPYFETVLIGDLQEYLLLKIGVDVQNRIFALINGI